MTLFSVRGPARHPRQERRARHRRPPRAGRRADAGRARVAAQRPAAGSGARRRARRRAGHRARARARAPARPARGGRLRRRGHRPRGRRSISPGLCATIPSGDRRLRHLRGRASGATATWTSSTPTTCATSQGKFVWIGLYEPTEEEFDSLRREFNLHPLAVEDAIHAHQRPKLEVYEDMVFLVLKTARYVDPTEVIELGELLVFLGDDYIITVRHGEASSLKPVREAPRGGSRPPAPRARRGAARDPRPGRGRLPAGDQGLETDIDEVEDELFSGERHEPGRAHLPPQARGAPVPQGHRAAGGADRAAGGRALRA